MEIGAAWRDFEPSPLGYRRGPHPKPRGITGSFPPDRAPAAKSPDAQTRWRCGESRVVGSVKSFPALQGKYREFLRNRLVLTRSDPWFPSLSAALGANSLSPRTGNFLRRAGNLSVQTGILVASAEIDLQPRSWVCRFGYHYPAANTASPRVSPGSRDCDPIAVFSSQARVMRVSRRTSPGPLQSMDYWQRSFRQFERLHRAGGLRRRRDLSRVPAPSEVGPSSHHRGFAGADHL